MSGITLSNVSFTYTGSKEPAVDDVSFHVEKGQLCAIVGANGSGKTTLCSIIRGFIPNFFKGELEGKVTIDGSDIADLDLGSFARHVGFVFQNPFVQISGAKDTVYEEVAFGLENLGVPVDEIHTRVNNTLKLINIEYLAEKNPNELSGGQKQRVAFASTLAMDPEFFVIDEPTSQLDPQGTDEIFSIIRTLKQQGKTIILVEHKMELIAEFADSVVVLEGGKIAMQGITAEVLSSTQLSKCGVAAPVYAQVGNLLARRGHSLETIPVTRAAAHKLFAQTGAGTDYRASQLVASTSQSKEERHDCAH